MDLCRLGLADQIKDLGFHPSLWLNPFMYTIPSAEAVIHHPERFHRETVEIQSPGEGKLLKIPVETDRKKTLKLMF